MRNRILASGICAVALFCAMACGDSMSEAELAKTASQQERLAKLDAGLADLEARAAALEGAQIQLDEKRQALLHQQKAVGSLGRELIQQQERLKEREQTLTEQVGALREALDSHAFEAQDLTESLDALSQAINDYDQASANLAQRTGELRAQASAMLGGRPSPAAAPLPPARSAETAAARAENPPVLEPAPSKAPIDAMWLMKLFGAALIIIVVGVSVAWILRPARSSESGRAERTPRPAPHKPREGGEAIRLRKSAESELGNINIYGAPSSRENAPAGGGGEGQTPPRPRSQGNAPKPAGKTE